MSILTRKQAPIRKSNRIRPGRNSLKRNTLVTKIIVFYISIIPLLFKDRGSQYLTTNVAERNKNCKMYTMTSYVFCWLRDSGIALPI